MRIGSFVFDTTQGLGVLANSFYRAGVVTDVMVVEHGRRPTNPDWYPNSLRIGDLRRGESLSLMKGFCLTMDAMLFFETPFNWSIVDYCRSRGIPTILMPMHECMPYPMPARFDYVIAPSYLDLGWAQKNGYDSYNSDFIPVPVEYPWKLREVAELFVHNAGHGGLRGRNGTQEFLEAIQYVESPSAKFLLRVQHDEFAVDRNLLNRIKHRLMIEGTVPYDQLFAHGDVFVFPEKFNGLSLPLQEAFASGMMVLATDRYPMNTWLPKSALVPASGQGNTQVSPRTWVFTESQVNPKVLANRIDYWCGRDISDYSRMGKTWAKGMTWEALKPRYTALLERLVAESREKLNEKDVRRIV